MPNHAADTRQVEVSSARSFTTVATGADGALNPDQQRRDRFTAMANVIEQAAQPIRRRLAQLEELITEQQQLKKALDALEGLTRVRPSTAAPRAQQVGDRRGARSGAGRRRPSGRQHGGLSRADQFVAVASERPITVAEAAERLNVSRQTLYNLTGRLQREGRLRKEGRHFSAAPQAPSELVP